ncbi:TPA: hypothetical protein ACGPJB_002810 [Yersinia enterocolitica]|nr:hypothetical protein [Yersinia enterocolitica]HEI6760988.1 hypothetical protein [Yersinia enterocolitica]HEI6825579.1 hypothetical protein [Yersinia enterocolitica]HEI6868677.1 hypothetical protein [Yersinia enterocolitica]
MKIYAQPGTLYYTLDLSSTPTCPNEYVEMSEERPGLNYIATEGGEWIKTEELEATS